MSVSLSTPFNAPETQRALLLHAPREAYKIAQIPLPALEKEDEVLIRIEAIGLNPVYVVNMSRLPPEMYLTISRPTSCRILPPFRASSPSFSPPRSPSIYIIPWPLYDLTGTGRVQIMDSVG